MQRFRDSLVLATVFGVAAGVAGVAAYRLNHLGGTPAPRTIFDVALAARERGLSARSDTEDGQIERTLVISRGTLTWEQARGGFLAARHFPGVAYAREREAWSDSKADEGEVHWGAVELTGDPAVIDELMGSPK